MDHLFHPEHYRELAELLRAIPFMITWLRVQVLRT